MLVRRALLALAFAMGPALASAQTIYTPEKAQAGGGPPVAVGPGWRYELRPPDVHMFLCQQDSCDRSSRVSYRLYAPNTTMNLARFRAEQETVVKALRERAPPGTQIDLLSVDGDDNSALPRMYKATRLLTNADGTREYVVSAVLLGAGHSASVINSSRNEAASKANHSLYGVAVLLLISRNTPKP